MNKKHLPLLQYDNFHVNTILHGKLESIRYDFACEPLLVSPNVEIAYLRVEGSQSLDSRRQ